MNTYGLGQMEWAGKREDKEEVEMNLDREEEEEWAGVLVNQVQMDQCSKGQWTNIYCNSLCECVNEWETIPLCQPGRQPRCKCDSPAGSTRARLGINERTSERTSNAGMTGFHHAPPPKECLLLDSTAQAR